MDYVVNIYNNKKYLFTLAANNADYDNIIWWELEDIINIKNAENMDANDLADMITSKSDYWYKLDKFDKDLKATNIDIANKTIDLFAGFPIYNMNDDLSGITVKNINGKYFAEYEMEDTYEISNISFDDEDLLNKTNLSYDEFLKVCHYLQTLIKDHNDDEVFILNNHLIIRFSFA